MEIRRRKVFPIVFAVVSIPVLVVLTGFVRNHPVVITKENKWAIGIYEGTSPYELSKTGKVNNPVLQASDVTDVKASFVADPFMLRKGSKWYMFFEVLNALDNKGDIGVAESDDGLKWTYRKIIIDEPFHLSYPYVFEWNGEIYLVPESASANHLRLYRASNFPYEWEFADTLLAGRFGDHGLFRYDNTWWLMANSEPSANNTLHLFYSKELEGPWTEHPLSPIVKADANKARPGGRVYVNKNVIIRYAQDCDPTYGKALNAFQIMTLTKTEYTERALPVNPILKAGWGGRWTLHGMHQLDAHELENGKWLACVDGYVRSMSFSLEY